MEHRFCPGCENHCPLDALKCRKGRNFFGVKTDDEPRREHVERDEPSVVSLIRRCGKFLHHGISPETNLSDLTNCLSLEETAALEDLLQKCLNTWQSDDHKRR